MSILTRMSDALVNVVANLNTGRDKQSASEYVDREFSPHELLTMYRNSWLAAAIVDYPAEDATRNWRHWRAQSDQISKIEAEENRLDLKSKLQEALIASRLYGGAVIYINTPDGDQSSPLVPGAYIRSLVVLTRHEIRAKEVIKDIDNPYYGRAEHYVLRSQGRSSVEVDIHASRFVILPGKPVPGALNESSSGWGDSYLQTTYDAILQTDNTMANIASLVFEAKVDVIKFQGFAEMMARNKDTDVIRRMHLQAAMKSNNGALVIDAQDDYDQKNASFAGLTDVAGKFQDNVSGAARIAVTRLFGRAAVGLSGSGDGDERVYYDRIGHTQKTVVSSALTTLDDCIIYQALGSRPAEVFYEWASLRQLTENERSDIFSKTATAARAIAGTNAGELIPLDALSESLVNELVELGVLPGLEQSISKYGSLSEQYEIDEEEEELVGTEGQTDPSEEDNLT